MIIYLTVVCNCSCLVYRILYWQYVLRRDGVQQGMPHNAALQLWGRLYAQPGGVVELILPTGRVLEDVLLRFMLCCA
jgi:hypothetical protein